MKRLGIFLIYDKENIIDRYVIYIAQELRKVTDRLVIVTIGEYSKSELKKIKTITKDIYCRDNKGFDSGAFKDTLSDYIGWDDVLQYDELVICNDTFYGPFWGFESIFEGMKEQECDFWGLTLHNSLGNFPTHVQSYFLNFRKELLHDNRFRDYWEKLEYPSNYDEARDFFEMAISTEFPKLGYTYSTYVNELEDNSNRDVSYDLVNWRSFYGIKRLNCPILKKKRFVCDLQLSDDIRKTLDYVSEKSSYDISMIWENAIRNYSVRELNNGYHLNHIFANDKLRTRKKNYSNVRVVAVIEKGNDEKMYIDNILHACSGIAITFIVSDMKLKKYIDQKRTKADTIVLRKYNNIFCNIEDTVDRLDDADYLLFITNRRKLELTQQQFNEEMAQNNVWDNLMLDSGYVSRIIEFLDAHKEFGILVPNKDDEIMSNVTPIDWQQIDAHIKELAELLDVPEALIDRVEDRFSSYTFWIRTEILRRFIGKCSAKKFILDDSNWERAIQSILPFYVKKSGYLPTVIENQRYAAMLRKRPAPVRIETKVEDHYTEKYIGLYKANLSYFTSQCDYLFIYGAGKIADRVVELLSECQIPYDGFVVTDGQEHESIKNNHSVREFSETLELKSSGYIVAVGEKIRPAIIEVLEKNGINKIYVL